MIFKVSKSNKRTINNLAKKHGLDITWLDSRNSLDIGEVSAYTAFGDLNGFILDVEATLLPDPELFLNLVEVKAEVDRARTQFVAKYGTTIDNLKL
jgi:hypothetical protein